MSIPLPSENGTCLVTGASAGIGTEFARQLAERGYNVTLVARRIDRLTEIAAEIEEEHNVRAIAIACDVSDAAQRSEMLKSIAARGEEIQILVNNAGIGTDGRFADPPTGAEIGQVEINVLAPTALCQAVVPSMRERGSGAILNVASTAAFQPMPRQSVYAATKAYVLSFSQGLSKDLADFGVQVTVLCPGPTRTEFFGDQQAEIEKLSPSFVWQDPDDCARAGLDGLFKGQRVVIPKVVNKAGAYSGKLAPTTMTLAVLEKFWPIGK